MARRSSRAAGLQASLPLAPPQSPTLRQVVENPSVQQAWLGHWTKKRGRESALSRVRTVMADFERAGIEYPTSEHLYRYLLDQQAAHRWAPSTCNQVISHLRRLYGIAGQIWSRSAVPDPTQVPTRLRRFRELRAKPGPLEPHELRAILAALPDAQARAFVLVLALMGPRCSEACGIQLRAEEGGSWIDLAAGVLHLRMQRQPDSRELEALKTDASEADLELPPQVTHAVKEALRERKLRPAARAGQTDRKDRFLFPFLQRCRACDRWARARRMIQRAQRAHSSGDRANHAPLEPRIIQSAVADGGCRGRACIFGIVEVCRAVAPHLFPRRKQGVSGGRALHAFRHAFGRALNTAKVPLAKAQKLLRHKTPVVTQRLYYGDVQVTAEDASPAWDVLTGGGTVPVVHVGPDGQQDAPLRAIHQRERTKRCRPNN